MAKASVKPIKNSEKPCLLLVDGSSYLHRAYHALPPLTNSKDQPTGAVYGVVNMLRKLIREHEHDYFAVVFDAPGKTFRDKIFPEYKANRAVMPDDLQQQIKPLHEIVQALGLPFIYMPGIEADDIIGTLAANAQQQHMECIISTGDKDFAQLVNDHITLVNTMTDTYFDREGVINKFGLPPERIVDYLSLIGDTVDNIPGVVGVGPKTAVKWLNEYGSLKEIINHAQEIKGKVGDNLRASLDRLELNQELTTIKKDMPLGININELTRKEVEHNKLIELFTELEFKTWLKELTNDEQRKSAAIDKRGQHYDQIDSEEKFDHWLKKLRETDLFSFDTETTSLNYIDARIVGVSFSTQANEAAYLPFGHHYPDAPEQLSENTVFAKLKPLLEDAQKAKVFHNAKYDMNVLANHQIELRGIAHDSMLESYVLNSVASRHDMDSLALNYLHYHTIHYEDVAGSGAKQITFDQVPLNKATPYAAEDADITLQLHQKLWAQLSQIPSMKKVYEEIEIPLISVLSRMECNGVLVNKDLLEQQSKEITARCAVLQEQAYKIADSVFNLSSSKQLQEILYQKMKLPILEKTPTGQPSTGESVLQELAHQYPLPKIILEYRSLMKLKTTYTDRLPEQINAQTGRVHTSYHQAITATGRLSSADPNLQNIPIRTEEGRRIRQAFCAPKGYRIIAADYSQIELRIVAHASGDPQLIAAFEHGLDIHTATAAEILGIPLDKVTSLQRRHAKAINFGLMYGMSAFGLARQLDIERDQAQQYITTYFHRYPGVKKFMEQVRVQAYDNGYVETFFGRRLYLPDLRSKNPMIRRQAERAATNAPMQGTAADIIKRAMILMDQWLQQHKIDARMIMQVHDELVFEVAENEITRVKEAIQKNMAGAAKLKVPLVVDIGVGLNWDEAH